MRKFINGLKTGVAVSLVALMVACGEEAEPKAEPEPEIVEQVTKEEPKKPAKKEEPKITAQEEIIPFSVTYSGEVLPLMTETFSLIGLIANEGTVNPNYLGSTGFSTDISIALTYTYDVEAMLSELDPQSPEVKKINDLFKEANLLSRESILLIEKGGHENNPALFMEASELIMKASELIGEATVILESIS